MALTINTEGLSAEQKATSDFKFVYNGMLAQLGQPSFIEALCIHETAHLAYFTAAGTTEYDSFPPRIVYNSETGEFDGMMAAVQPKDVGSPKGGNVHEWLFIIAKAHAAGGVAARKFLPTTDGGDEHDKERFLLSFGKYSASLNLSAEDLWTLAQGAVAKDLENPAAWERLQQFALGLRKDFGL